MPVTNLLAMPLTQITVQTGTNEDWVDSILYLVDDGTLTPPQLDLRDIMFEMEVRRAPPEHEVIISATTENGSLQVGDPPNYGYLLIAVELEEMKTQVPGTYVGDIIGKDQESQRVIAQFDLTIVQGITR